MCGVYMCVQVYLPIYACEGQMSALIALHIIIIIVVVEAGSLIELGAG